MFPTIRPAELRHTPRAEHRNTVDNNTDPDTLLLFLDNNIDPDTLLLDNFDLILSAVTDEDDALRTELYMDYAKLKFILFKRLGRREDLEEAIAKGRYAVAETREEHGDYAMRLSDFGGMLISRCMQTRTMEDLEETIRIIQQAIQIASDDHPAFKGMLNNLGAAFGLRYELTKNMEDLDESIRTTQQIVQFVSDDYSGLPAVLNNLRNALHLRYKRTGTMEDLEKVIQTARQIIQIAQQQNISEYHSDFARWLNNLGNLLYSRYERTGTMENLEEALRIKRRAIQIISEDHSDFTWMLDSLGTTLVRRYERTGKVGDLEEAIQVTERAWRCTNATPFLRVRAAMQALSLLLNRKHFERAYSLAVEAINLLPYIHNRSLDHRDQKYVVSHFSELATIACSLALQTGNNPEVALEILEQGRGLILRLLMDDRSDTSELQAFYPELYARYESLRLKMNKPVEDVRDDQTRKFVSTDRTEAFAKLEDCVQHIQRLPEFSYFHKSLTAKQMQSCSTTGSIVVVNITYLRSDAVIITANAFKVLPLFGLSAGQATDWIAQDLTTTSLNDRGRKNKVYLQFLSWLWHECVSPVLDELQCHVQSSTNDLPRIWWMGTGLASTFPFHSAGDISAGPSESACYRAISSYTSTIKALQYSQERVSLSSSTIASTLSDRNFRSAVIVTMPETPGANPLPGSRLEEVEVKAAMKPWPSISIETLEHPDVESTMAQLQGCNVAHFACHGVSNPLDPSKSGLILRTTKNPLEEPQQDILSVQKISQANLSQAKIAYLSACSIARNETTTLPDEVLHVVSGFQVVGFRHVIGCLWPSDDKVCVEVAKLFYSELGQDRDRAGKFNIDRTVALALHKAIMKIRESKEYRKRPLLWAQYVHFGA